MSDYIILDYITWANRITDQSKRRSGILTTDNLLTVNQSPVVCEYSSHYAA